MKINPKEPDELYNLESWLFHGHNGASLKLVFNDGSIINAISDGGCESDNCLDINDPDYEEYYAMFFRNIETDKIFEVNYHNFPKEIWYEGEKLDLKKL